MKGFVLLLTKRIIFLNDIEVFIFDEIPQTAQACNNLLLKKNDRKRNTMFEP